MGGREIPWEGQTCEPEWNESEHDRTGGPAYCTEGCCGGVDSFCNNEHDAIGVPLQEQVEQVEDALGKALTVIEAFVEQEKDLRTLVYQAQLDAQDWQNKFNAIKDDGYLEDRERLLDNCRDLYRQECEKVDQLNSRIIELTDLNTQLEVRNERLAKRSDTASAHADRIKSALKGYAD